MATERERAELGRQQEALLRSLITMGAPAPGFPAARLELASLGLCRKRMRAVARAWPELRRGLGERFPELFLSHARATVKPPQGGSLADGWAFRRWLGRAAPEAAADESTAGRLEALRVELEYYEDGERGLIRRRGACVRVARLPERVGVVVGFRLPGAPVRLWTWRPPRLGSPPRIRAEATRPARLGER